MYMFKTLKSKNFRGPLVSICLGLLLVFVSQYFAYRNVKHLAGQNILLNQTTRIIHEAASLGQEVKDLELSVFGYLSTDSLALLKDNYSRRVQLAKMSDTLFALVKNDPDQTRRVSQLAEIATKIGLLSHDVMKVYRFEGFEKARKLIQESEAFKLNHLMMSKIKEIQRYENLNLDARRRMVYSSEKKTTLFITGTGIAGFLLTLVAIGFLVHDQNKQRDMQEEINKKEGALKQYVEAITDGIMVVNLKKEILLLNQSGKEMLGLKEGQFPDLNTLMQNIHLFNPKNPGDMMDENSLPVTQALIGLKQSANKINVHIDNRIKNLESNVSPIYEMNGVVSSAITVFRDITERVNYEITLENARMVAEKSVKVKDIFLSNVSHEIRTPLNAIIGFTNLLESRLTNEKDLEYVGYIQLAGRNLLDLINDILDFSKIEADQVHLEKTPTSVKELIASVSVLVSQRAKEKQIAYEVTLSDGLPEIIVADQLRLTQILLNICGNAVKFTDKGSVKLVVEPASPMEDEVQTIRFSITDTGIGIQEDKIREIFERFVQSTESTTRLFGGTGLGLSIVKSLVTLFGGTVDVRSVINEGTTFVVECPFKIMNKNAYDEIVVSESVAIVDLPKIKILAAEDNLLNQKLLVAIFERIGLDFRIAGNGLEAIQILESEPFDVVIMDLQMPVMDGYSAIKQIRSSISTTIPIITMTAHALVGEKEECMSIGANAYISKPFKQTELLNTLWHVTTGKDAAVKPENKITIDQKTMANKDSIVNISYLNEITGNSIELRDELISMFENESEIQLPIISGAANKKEIDKLIHSIHKYRSSLFSVGLLATADKYKIIEGNLKKNIWEEDTEKTILEIGEEAKTGLSELLQL